MTLNLGTSHGKSRPQFWPVSPVAVPAESDQVVFVGITDAAARLVFGDAGFEEVFLLFEEDDFIEPAEGIDAHLVEGGQAQASHSPVGVVLDVIEELLLAHAYDVLGKTVRDEFLFQFDAFAHEVGEFLAEFGSPDVGVFVNEFAQDIAAEGDVVGLVTQRVLEHLADAGHLVLPVQREDHCEKGVKLRPLHDLGDGEKRLCKPLLVRGQREVDPHLHFRHVPRDEVVFLPDGGDVLELGGHFVQVNVQAANDMQQRIHVDGLLGDVAEGGVFEFGRGEVVLDDVEDRVADDAFGGREVADAHLDDPALLGGKCVGVPLVGVFGHVDDVRFPVVRLHLFVDAVGFVVFERENVQFCGAVAVDDFFSCKPFPRLGFVQAEGFVPELVNDDIPFFPGGDISLGADEIKGVGGRGVSLDGKKQCGTHGVWAFGRSKEADW